MIVVHVGNYNELDNRQRSSSGRNRHRGERGGEQLGRGGRGYAPRRVSETNESLRYRRRLSRIAFVRFTHSSYSLATLVRRRSQRSLVCYASLARYSLQQRFFSEPLLTRSFQSLVDAILVRRIASEIHQRWISNFTWFWTRDKSV